MKRLAILLIIVLFLVGTGALGLIIYPIGTSADLTGLKGDASRGAYLARMSGCIACHTNIKKQGAPLAGGVELKTDFGTFFSPNLTTHKKAGIGSWDVNDFAKAVRQGISPEGEPYYPAFPYPFYASMTDQDVADLWAAFKTVPPVEKVSKSQELKLPFNFRSGLKLWRGAFVDFKPFEPVAGKSDLWNRGKYIVEGPAHCGACHTPRNFAGVRDSSRKFYGATGLPEGGKSPAITPEKLKQNGWTVNDLKYALKTGIQPDGDVFGGSMGEVVRDGTAYLSDKDREAIATFILDVK